MRDRAYEPKSPRRPVDRLDCVVSVDVSDDRWRAGGFPAKPGDRRLNSFTVPGRRKSSRVYGQAACAALDDHILGRDLFGAEIAHGASYPDSPLPTMMLLGRVPECLL